MKIKHIHSIVYSLICCSMLLFTQCTSTKQTTTTKPKPTWIDQRPSGSFYYVGIGMASKKENPLDFQQAAKRNALNDLIGEIKVQVSSNSILSQYQNNAEFNQQFSAYSKITSLASIDHFDVVDSWDDGANFYIYYRLSKAEYEESIRNKMNSAIDRSLDLLNRSADESRLGNPVSALRFKLKALCTLQDYLNEDLKASYQNKDVYLVNEILEQIQVVLAGIRLRSELKSIPAKAGQQIENPVNVYAEWMNQNSTKPVVGLPLKASDINHKMKVTTSDITDETGAASFVVERILSSSPVQSLHVGVDLLAMAAEDTLHLALKTILNQLELPFTSIRFTVTPIHVFLVSREKALGVALENKLFESIFKRTLTENGCSFTSDSTHSDFIVYLQSDTRSQGAIWREMQYVNLDFQVSVIKTAAHVEIYTDGIQGVRGYQITPEKASIDAYNNAQSEIQNRILPGVLNGMEIIRPEK